MRFKFSESFTRAATKALTSFGDAKQLDPLQREWQASMIAEGQRPVDESRVRRFLVRLIAEKNSPFAYREHRDLLNDITTIVPSAEQRVRLPKDAADFFEKHGPELEAIREECEKAVKEQGRPESAVAI